MRVTYTAGVFDLLHAGHLNMLWRSKEQGDVLVVGVVSDAGTRAYKHRLPVENVQQRMDAIRRLSFVDVVVMQNTSDPTPNLLRFQPAVFTHGDADGEWSALHAQVAACGVEYRNLPYTVGISTSMLRGVA